MESSRFESLTLVAAVIGAAVLGSQALAIGLGAGAVGDIAILLALFAFDSGLTRSGGQSIAFAGTGAFCLLTPFIFIANAVLGAKLSPDSPWMLGGLWLVLSLILFALDLFRMSSRHTVSFADSGLAAAGPIKPIVASAPISNYRPAPIRVDTAPPTAPPAYEPVKAAIIPDLAPEFSATTIADSPVLTSPAPTLPPVMAIPPGKEVLIYLNLVGEGLNVLRTVRAENLGRDYYRIADIMPEGEQWEFTPGMVVRCRKKNLSNGKQLVAFEEAPRSL